MTMKTLLAIFSCAVVALAIDVRPGSTQHELGHVRQMIDISSHVYHNASVQTIKMPTLATDEDHGFCFKMGFEYGSTDSGVVKKKEAETTAAQKTATNYKTGTADSEPTSSLVVDFGLSLEPERFGPFFVFKFNFPKSFGQMFSKISSAIDKVMTKIGISPENKAKITKTKDTLKNFANTLSSLKKTVKDTLKKNFPTLYWIFEHFNMGINTGNRDNKGGDANSNSGNNGWLFDFRFTDDSNAGNPSLQIEWRLQNSNEFTACCVDLVNPVTGFVPAIAPGTCGWSNQGLHAQGQIGGVKWLDAIASMILPLDKTLASYIKKDPKTGKPIPKIIGKKPFEITMNEYDFPAMKRDIIARFAELKGDGGVVGGIMATLVNGIANAAKTALSAAVFKTTLELRVALFTAGFSGEFKIIDVINKVKTATDALVAKLPKTTKKTKGG